MKNIRKWPGIFMVLAIAAIMLAGCGGSSDSTAPPPPTGFQLKITDSCNDGYYIRYKVYDEDTLEVWPSSSTDWGILYGESFIQGTQDIACTNGDYMCVGASQLETNLAWGVGELNNFYPLAPDAASYFCGTCAPSTTLDITLACP